MSEHTNSEIADKIEANLHYLQNHEYNPFEPDNQNQAFFVVSELSKQLAPILTSLRQPPSDATPQFCFSEWWNSLKDAERAAIIRDSQWSRERVFRAGYAAALTQVKHDA